MQFSCGLAGLAAVVNGSVAAVTEAVEWFDCLTSKASSQARFTQYPLILTTPGDLAAMKFVDEILELCWNIAVLERLVLNHRRHLVVVECSALPFTYGGTFFLLLDESSYTKYA